jgi:hypothetical protein
VVRRDGAVDGAEGPAVVVFEDLVGSNGDDGLDGNDESVGKAPREMGVVVVGDFGFLVDRAADAVPAEFADNAKALAVYFPLD